MDDHRTHLIERAAARLRSSGTAPDPSAYGTLSRSAAERKSGPSAIELENSRSPQRIPLTALAEAGLLCWDQPNHRIAEEFRIIQEKILRQSFGANGSASDGHKNLVMVTSALKEEGKTFCALNIAGEIARQADRRVLLIDADPKPNGLGRVAAGFSEQLGFRDLAQSKHLDVASLALPTEAGSLEFLPFGKNGEANAELFASRRMAQAIDEIGRRYSDRLIIFDAPPCLSSSTPHTLAAVMGQVVFVVSSGYTQQDDVEAALHLLQACPNISLLLNKIPVWMSHSYGSYGFGATAA